MISSTIFQSHPGKQASKSVKVCVADMAENYGAFYIIALVYAENES